MVVTRDQNIGGTNTCDRAQMRKKDGKTCMRKNKADSVAVTACVNTSKNTRTEIMESALFAVHIYKLHGRHSNRKVYFSPIQ